MKKILPGILIIFTVAVMLFTALAISADDAPVIKGALSTNKTEYARGETVQLTGTLTANDGFGILVLGFDEFPEILERTTVEDGNTYGVEKNGSVPATMLASKNLVFDAGAGDENNVTTTATGTIFTGSYKIPKDAAPGDYTIKVVIIHAARDNSQSVENPEIETSDVAFGEVTFTVTNDVVTYIPGDINNDGSVDNKDLTRLFQYLSDWDVEVNTDALDVNGDKSIDNKDLTRLFQYLSDWDVQIY